MPTRLPPPTRQEAVVQMSLELYAVDGHIQGRLHPDEVEPVAFCGVLELLAALEQLDPPPPTPQPPPTVTEAT
jgi:hypothetical protein